MPINLLLARLIWLCVLPLVALAVYLAVYHVKAVQTQIRRDATYRVQNMARALDLYVGGQIAALEVLAASPLADDPHRLGEFYREAQAFHEKLGSHVILTDLSEQVIFNTNAPLGSARIRLPRLEGPLSAEELLKTGKLIVGDMFFGPILKEYLVVAAVPVARAGRTRFVLRGVMKIRRLQEQVDEVFRSPGWCVTLLDGKGDVMVRSCPAGQDIMVRFAAKCVRSSWSVILDVPRSLYIAPVVGEAEVMAAAILCFVLISIVVGRVVGRRLAHSVASLVEDPSQDGPSRPFIAEVEAVRARLSEAAEALRQSEAKYRLIADSADEWIYWVAPDGSFRYVSPACEQLTGYSQEEFFGRPELIGEVVHPEDREAFERHSAKMREECGPEEMEFRIVAKSGKVCWISHSCGPMYTPEGQYAGRRGTNRDITERKNAEELELLRKYSERYAAELEQRVQERTAQLESVNKELEAFSYSVSHDLRAPLRHVNGYVDLLVNRFADSLPEKGIHYLHEISESARQMGTLVDDLLQFSGAGRQEMHRTNVDMDGVLGEALQAVQKDISGRTIEWVVPQLPRVFGDPAMLRLVWLNLLSNAVKFTRDVERTRIEIGVCNGGKEWVFFVRDNGVGFDMQYAHKLFGVFQRLHSAAEFEGTGIGLANVRRIVARHGGRAWAEAEPGKGATIYFTLQNSLVDDCIANN